MFAVSIDGQDRGTNDGFSAVEQDCVTGFEAHGLQDADHLLQLVVKGRSPNNLQGQGTEVDIDSIT